MAETIKTTSKIKDDNDWRKSTGVDYAIYHGTEEGEKEYVSPTEVSKESIEKIKQRKIRLGRLALGNLAA